MDLLNRRGHCPLSAMYRLTNKRRVTVWGRGAQRGMGNNHLLGALMRMPIDYIKKCVLSWGWLLLLMPSVGIFMLFSPLGLFAAVVFASASLLKAFLHDYIYRLSCYMERRWGALVAVVQRMDDSNLSKVQVNILLLLLKPLLFVYDFIPTPEAAFGIIMRHLLVSVLAVLLFPALITSLIINTVCRMPRALVDLIRFLQRLPQTTLTVLFTVLLVPIFLFYNVAALLIGHFCGVKYKRR